MIDELFAPASHTGGDFGQPNRGLSGFNLTEERSNATEFVMPPVLEQARGFRRYLPLTRILEIPPLVHLTAEFINDGSGVILLFRSREPFALVENECALIPAPLLFRLWDRRDELRTATGFNDLLRWVLGHLR